MVRESARILDRHRYAEYARKLRGAGPPRVGNAKRKETNAACLKNKIIDDFSVSHTVI